MSMEQKQQLLSQAKAAIENTSAYKNLQLLFDGGVFSEIDAYAKSENGYAEVIAAYGMANGCPIFAFAQNSDIAGGAMSTAQALYVLPSGRERDPSKGPAVIQVEYTGETAYSVDVTVDLLDENGETVTGVECYAFPYEFVEDHWVFTDFRMVY